MCHYTIYIVVALSRTWPHLMSVQNCLAANRIYQYTIAYSKEGLIEIYKSFNILSFKGGTDGKSCNILFLLIPY